MRGWGVYNTKLETRKSGAIHMGKNYPKRLLLCVTGLMLYGLGSFFGVIAGSAGTNAWSTLSLGLAGKLGVSYGTGNIIISILVLGVDLLCRGKLGVGSVLNAFLVALFSDFFIGTFTFIPPAENMALGVVYTLLGQVIIAFATIVYTLPALGCGPRDTLLVTIGRRFARFPIGTVKFGMEIFVLLLGVALGAPFGLGTVLVLALQASIFQLVCRLCRYEIRSIEHEDLIDTYRYLLKGGK